MGRRSRGPAAALRLPAARADTPAVTAQLKRRPRRAGAAVKTGLVGAGRGREVLPRPRPMAESVRWGPQLWLPKPVVSRWWGNDCTTDSGASVS